MYYEDLVKIYSELEKTTKRLEKVEIISEFLKRINKDELDKVIKLLQGKVYADWEDLKLGMSERLILKVINQSTGISTDKIENLWKKKGDLGKVAEELIKEKPQRTLTSKKLTLDKVYENLRKLATMEGEGTVGRKFSLISELLSNSTPTEARHIVNNVIGDLRVGVAAGIIRDSIAKAFNKDVKEVEENYNLSVDYGKVAELCKEGKLKLSLTPGNPIKLMLAIKVESIEEAFKAVGKPAQCEYKLDGFRLQCHFDGKEIKLFTRRMENVTKQFPDVVKYLKDNVNAKSYIIDSEACGISKDGKYLPFQNISQRIRRKYDIESMARDFPVELNVFDVIYYNGKNLMNEELIKRRKILENIINEKKESIILTPKIITDNNKEVKKFYDEALAAGTEGLMIKNLKSKFKPGRYVKGWIKLKPILEPLDLVITGATWGEGKRSDWLSSFIISCKKDDSFLEIGRFGTGVKEKNEGVTFSKLTKILKKYITKSSGKKVEIKPKIIVQVSYEEIQKSPNYSSGYALRFPRLNNLRVDLGLNDVDTLERIKRIYKNQRGQR
jgi:DNA ligase-1